MNKSTRRIVKLDNDLLLRAARFYNQSPDGQYDEIAVWATSMIHELRIAKNTPQVLAVMSILLADHL